MVGADIAVELAAISRQLPYSPLSRSGSYTGVSNPRSETLPPPPSPPLSTSSVAARDGNDAPRASVAVFGGAVADIVSKPYPGSVLTPGTSTPGVTRQSFGGVGRNVAEGLARVLLARGETLAAGGNDSSDCDAEITLVSAVGADDAGRALVAGCEQVGVSAQVTVQVGLDAERDEGGPGTASYVAMLGGDGELMAAVADMRVLETMTAVRTHGKCYCGQRFL